MPKAKQKQDKLAPVKIRNSWLERLGIIGFNYIEPVVLAALVTGHPLLLIGPHGTAKSLILTKIASALNLDFKHYNASLLNFDDLVGFPLPDQHGSLQYVRTPASVWGAGAVIFDEISRARPDIQNKLFPIIHERRVQGLLLEQLQYRWAAMNPPSTDDDENGYIGSEPLDAALADRFAFIVCVPDWTKFSPSQQIAIIQAEDQAVKAEDIAILNEAIDLAKHCLNSFKNDFRSSVALYVQTVTALLGQAGVSLSPRRANLIYKNILAVNAACIAAESDISPSEATLLALRNSLPQIAQGISIPEVKLLSAHKEAIRTISLDGLDPLREILVAISPLKRIQLAIKSKALPKSDFSSITADSLSQLPLGAREAAIVHLFETGAVGRLNAAVAAQIGDEYKSIVSSPNFTETVHAGNPRYKTWGRIKGLLATLNPTDPRAHLQANAVAALFSAKRITSTEEAEFAFNAFADTDLKLRII